VAVCGGVTRTSQFTTGGKVGAAVATEVYLSWQDCPDEISYTVRWPSGVTSSHLMAGMEYTTTATEPLWYSVSDVGEGNRVLNVQSELLGDEIACFQAKDSDVSTCCQPDSPCSFELGAELGSPGVLRIGESPLGMRIDPPEGDVVLVTDPELPVPGQSFSIRVGQGRAALEGLEPWVRVAGDKVPWVVTDKANNAYKAEKVVPAQAEELSVKVFVNGKTKFNESIPAGWMLDPRVPKAMLFPYEDSGTTKMWRVITAPASGIESIDKEKLEVRLGDGTVLPSVKWTRGTFGRFFLEIPWELLPEGGTVSVYEQNRLRLGPFPTYHAAAIAEDVENRATSVRGFTTRPVMLEDGDNTRVYFSLLDEMGVPLPPRPEHVTFETEGLVQASEITVPNVMTWELTAMFVSTPGLEDGKITFKNAKTGDVLGVWLVKKRPRIEIPVPVDFDRSSVSIDYDSLPAGVGASAKVSIQAFNIFGELLGPDAVLTAVASEGLVVGELGPEEYGTHAMTVEPGFYGGEHSIEVFASGELLGEVTLEVVGPEAPGLPNHVSYPEADVSTVDNVSAEELAPPHVEPDGCRASGSGHLPIVLLLAFGALAWAALRRRLRNKAS